MKKIWGISVVLLLCLTACQKNSTVIIKDEGEYTDYYSCNIGLGESISMEIDKVYENEDVLRLAENGKISYDDKFQYKAGLEDDSLIIDWTGFSSFTVTCQNAFEDSIEIDYLTFSENEYEFTFPVHIELFYNSSYDTCFPNVFDMDYPSGENEIEGIIDFSPAYLGYSKDDTMVFESASSCGKKMILSDVKYAVKDTTTSSVRFTEDDYIQFGYPLNVRTYGAVTRFVFYWNMPSGLSSFAEDIQLVFTIDGDVHTVYLHCFYKQ